jgi:putative membrane protein
MKSVLSPADLAQIEEAVREAEAGTTGEIYCVAAEESADYHETPLAWGALVALLAPALLLAGGVHVTFPQGLGGGWSAAQMGEAAEAAAHHALWGTLILQVVLFAATTALVSAGPLRRALTPRSVKRERVRRRAREQFLARNMQLTRERTGVLIYVSFAERMAELVADDAIASVVDPTVWDQAMAVLIARLKRQAPGAGFAAAVRLCGQVLAERFPARPGDNPNEISDAPVILPRS